MRGSLLKINQTLHGYRKGHRLLASSFELPRKMERRLSIQSDLSGPFRTPGFDTYLSGYPLEEVSLYAFARTWYADENDRPGCVWTHTLLISPTALSTIQDLSVLNQLFRRPESEQFSEKKYSKSIELSDDLFQGRQTTRSIDSSLVRKLLSNLYDVQERPVMLTANDSLQYETLILSVWSQQWPTLRKAFSFSTGSISTRQIDGIPFQLQIVPNRSLRSSQTISQELTVIDLESRDEVLPEWASFAEKDLGSGGLSHLWYEPMALGGPVPGRRKYFPIVIAMTETISKHSDEAEHGQVSENTLKSFLVYVSHIHQTGMLLDLLLSVESESLFGIAVLKWIVEIATFDQLAKTGGLSEALLLQVQWSALSKREWMRKFAGQLEELRLNDFGKALVHTLLEELSKNVSAKTVSDYRKLLPELIKLNPEFLTLSEAWKGTKKETYAILETLKRVLSPSSLGRRPEKLSAGIVVAVLDAGQYWLGEAIVDLLGNVAVEAALNWFDRESSEGVDLFLVGWKSVLSMNPLSVNSWLSHHTSQLGLNTACLVTNCINPDAVQIENLRPSIWLMAVSNINPEDASASQVRVASFIIAVSFRERSHAADSLVKRAFPAIHAALLSDRLEAEQWYWIARHVPDLGLFSNWDRGERLRVAIIDCFTVNRWPVEGLEEMFNGRLEWTYFVKTCLSNRDGRVIVSKLLQGLETRSIDLPSWKVSVLKDLGARSNV